VVQLLVKAEAVLDLPDKVSWLNTTVQCGVRAIYSVRFVSCMWQTGWTALMWAAHRGITASVSTLLQGGASREIVNNVSATSCHSASTFLYDVSFCTSVKHSKGRPRQRWAALLPFVW
jgi:hypothetical protein